MNKLPLVAAALIAGEIAYMFLSGAKAAQIDTSAGPVTITEMAGGLTEPWSITFLPDGAFLVTERGGQLVRFGADGSGRSDVGGVPQVQAGGQGGLLDVVAARDFAASRTLFLTFAEPQDGGGAGTALARATLSADGLSLSDVIRLWSVPPGTGGGVHFGGRLVEAADGHLFLTLGERGDGPRAQDLGRAQGKVIRLMADGSIPADNPYAGLPGTLPEVWSWGHRNPQGAALDAGGQLWVGEHGAKGGDEINRVLPGLNYGWPVISYGTDYDGSKIGVGTDAPGMEQPAHYWDPSIAPSGLMIYSGRLWPEWAGDFFSGSLKFDHVSRLDPDRTGPGGWAEERLTSAATGRVRDVREAPDGSIWFLSVKRGAVYRMTPAG